MLELKPGALPADWNTLGYAPGFISGAEDAGSQAQGLEAVTPQNRPSIALKTRFWQKHPLRGRKMPQNRDTFLRAKRRKRT